MNAYLKIILIALLFHPIFFNTILYSQSLRSPLLYKGGADSQVYKSDTVVLENSALDEGLPVLPEDSIAAGLSFLYSGGTSFFYIPVSYSIMDYLEFNCSIPYVSKTMTDAYNNMYSKSGYGDLKLGLKFYYRFKDVCDSISGVKIILPTGDPDASDRYTVIPMGYGSPAVSLLQTFSRNLQDLKIRFFLNLGAVYYFKSEREIGSTSYEIESTHCLSTMAGIEYKYTEKLFFQLKANFIYIPESRYTSDNSDETFDLNDSIKSSDLIPGVRYGFRDDITGYLLLLIPVYEYQDDDIRDTEHRQWKFFVSLTKKF